MVGRSREKLKIILVDDDVTFRNILKKFFQEEFQYIIIGEASGGKEFFELPNIILADVILIDLKMPEMDGYEIAKRMFLEYNQIPIVAITMYSEKAYLHELIEVGFKGCVFKSDLYSTIQDAIHAVLNKDYYFPKDINM